MSDLESENKREKTEFEQSEFFKKIEAQKPLFPDIETALEHTQNELNKMAANMNLSVEQFLLQAESSKFFNEDFFRGPILQGRISFYKSKLK